MEQTAGGYLMEEWQGKRSRYRHRERERETEEALYCRHGGILEERYQIRDTAEVTF